MGFRLGAGRNAHDLNARPLGDCSELAKLIIVVPYEIPRALTVGRSLPKLLSGPGVAGGTGHIEVHDLFPWTTKKKAKMGREKTS